MQITIDLPDKLTQKVQDKWGDLSQKVLDKLVLEAFLEGLINCDEFREILGFDNDISLKDFLSANIPLHNSGLLNLAGSCADIDFTVDNLGVCDEMDDDLVGVFDE
ncbi:hypothetical protein IQ247_14910 [Plectonema cf. radiosum LEGE 06105]|uniref:Uncharacterized protein n=1 Tax=Plectonema cf. radiosum LEGE 06105 TaxID=945769 RepID=A0A8J7JUX5_9CYAN|nr:hypothetical protein [Plectonema radiosum]MBE9213940.1 hypothetical protein [Plectonema cf. radiosum LEGE 06105]